MIKELQKNQMLRHYLIQSKLGSGGMGDVFRAVDTITNNIVAIKSMKSTSSKNARNRFMREYKFLKAVAHENLIKAYELFEENNEIYMVLEYVNGIALSDLLNKEFSGLSLKEKIAIGSKVARGIEVLNTAGIIHRDIKPSNVMVNLEHGVVKILDLGLGKTLLDENTQLTEENQVLGTMMYLSPEQINGEVTRVTDIFSLGIILYQMFTNTQKSPFEGDSSFNCYYLIAYHIPPSIDKVIGSDAFIYKKLANMTSLALEKKPEKRCSEAKIIAEELEAMYSELNEASGRFKITKVNFNFIESIAENKTLCDEDVFIEYVPKLQTSTKKTTSYDALFVNTKKQQKILLERSSIVARRTGRYKQGKKKNKNILTIVAIIIAFLLLIMFVLLAEKKPRRSKKISRKNLQKIIPKKVEIPFDAKIWNICWNEENYTFDFTKKIWEELESNKKIEYASKYQVWYAKKRGFQKAEKVFFLGKSKEKIKMMLIPPGIFFMGSPLSEKGRFIWEEKHIAEVKSYWLGKYEITQKQWMAISNSALWEKDDDDLPATYITWNQLQWKLKDAGYTLPTEAEWEYACRAGTNGRFYWGEDENAMGKYANVLDKTARKRYGWRMSQEQKDKWRTNFDDGSPDLAKVGSFKENAFGLHDMLGNLFEWCRDLYDENYNVQGIKNTEELYVLKGGSWFNFNFEKIRPSFRTGRIPEYKNAYIGARISKKE